MLDGNGEARALSSDSLPRSTDCIAADFTRPRPNVYCSGSDPLQMFSSGKPKELRKLPYQKILKWGHNPASFVRQRPAIAMLALHVHILILSFTRCSLVCSQVIAVHGSVAQPDVKDAKDSIYAFVTKVVRTRIFVSRPGLNSLSTP